MINFYPGPSQLYESVGKYYQEGFQSGIFSMNHRSEDFMQLSAATKQLLKQKLAIPADYEMVFISSATEAWEIIAQSFVSTKSFHYYNGAFGEKWFEYTRKIIPNSEGTSFKADDSPSIESLPQAELIALTHNETSNGTELPIAFQQAVRAQFTDSLIAYDATSSMGGRTLEWTLGDIWFASVQKCFGLPPGLAIMVCSPKAIDKALSIGDDTYYNSFPFVLQNGRKEQTHYTPNIPAIYLLNRVMNAVDPIEKINTTLTTRFEQFWSNVKNISPLTTNQEVLSRTVFCIAAGKVRLTDLKQAAKAQNILLGNGYGPYKESTFRVANFPAISDENFQKLIDFLNYFSTRY